MADGSTPKNDGTRLAEIEADVARAIGERPVCPHPPGLLGNDFCARCDAAAAMPVIRDQLSRVRTDTIEEACEAIRKRCCHADDRWGIDYSDNIENCMFCKPKIDDLRELVRGVSHEH